MEESGFFDCCIRQTGRKERLGMNHKPYSGRLLAGLAAIVFAAVACGSTSAPAATSKGNITIAGFAFSEGSVLAELYWPALQHYGYKWTLKLKRSSRGAVAPSDNI